MGGIQHGVCHSLDGHISLSRHSQSGSLEAWSCGNLCIECCHSDRKFCFLHARLCTSWSILSENLGAQLQRHMDTQGCITICCSHVSHIFLWTFPGICVPKSGLSRQFADLPHHALGHNDLSSGTVLEVLPQW